MCGAHAGAGPPPAGSTGSEAGACYPDGGPALPGGGTGPHFPGQNREFSRRPAVISGRIAERLWRRRQGRERRIAFELCRLQARDLRPPRVGFGGADRLRCGVGSLSGLAVTGPRWVRLGRSHSCSSFCWRDRSARVYCGRSRRRANARCVALCAAPGSGLLLASGTGRRGRAECRPDSAGRRIMAHTAGTGREASVIWYLASLVLNWKARDDAMRGPGRHRPSPIPTLVPGRSRPLGLSHLSAGARCLTPDVTTDFAKSWDRCAGRHPRPRQCLGLPEFAEAAPR